MFNISKAMHRKGKSLCWVNSDTHYFIFNVNLKFNLKLNILL